MHSPAAPHRLGDALVARHYDIHLCASPRSKQFTGLVTLSATCTAPAKALVLHARGLTVQAALARQGRRELPLRCEVDADNEQIRLSPAEGALARGPLTLVVAYRGQLADSMHGLYLAKDGPEEALVSQCEASDARAILPCLDEPSHKATFAWTVTTEADLDVITNGAVQAVRRHGRRAIHRFKPTAKMSTYLLAITIGRFDSSPKATVMGVPCRIWSGRNKAAQTAFAMQVTRGVLPWYTKYFGEKYAYHKLDQVAVPGFDAGAMENCGAIFYRQSLLLMELGNTSRQAQKRIAEVIAHEIAHQWFGNLVTMQWWDDLWLNEAFATWIAFKVCNELYPDWQIWLDYLEAKEAALSADALASTHPIWAPVASPAQATELFDVITYEKGCGVLRMLERYLGDKKFRAGIRRYVKKHRFANAEGRELWQQVAAASGEDVGELMRHWIKRPGFPLVRSELVPGDGGATLRLTQQRFVEGAAAGEDNEGPWPVPMVVAYHDGKAVRRLRHRLDGERGELFLPAAKGKAVELAYANDDASGFFRLHVDDASFARLLSADADVLGVSGRLSLLTDQWALMRGGQAHVDRALEAFVAFGHDPHPSIFRAIAGRLRAMHGHLVADKDVPAFRAFVGDVARRHLERLGADDQALYARREPTEAALYASVLDTLGSLARDADILRRMRAGQAAEQRDPAAIDANVAGSVVALSAVQQDLGHYRHLLDVYKARKQRGTTPELQGRYLGALCMAEEGPCLSLVLEACLDGRIPQEQLRSVVAVLLMRRHSGRATWAWLKKAWPEVAPKVGSMGIARLVESTGALPHALKDDVQSFFRAHPVAEAERAIKKSAEAMDLWHALSARETPVLSRWLKGRRG